MVILVLPPKPVLCLPKATSFACVIHNHWTQIFEEYHWLPQHLEGQQLRRDLEELARMYPNLANVDSEELDLLDAMPMRAGTYRNEVFDFTYRNHLLRVYDRHSNVVIFLANSADPITTISEPPRSMITPSPSTLDLGNVPQGHDGLPRSHENSPMNVDVIPDPTSPPQRENLPFDIARTISSNSERQFGLDTLQVVLEESDRSSETVSEDPTRDSLESSKKWTNADPAADESPIETQAFCKTEGLFKSDSTKSGIRHDEEVFIRTESDMSTAKLSYHNIWEELCSDRMGSFGDSWWGDIERHLVDSRAFVDYLTSFLHFGDDGDFGATISSHVLNVPFAARPFSCAEYSHRTIISGPYLTGIPLSHISSGHSISLDDVSYLDSFAHNHSRTNSRYGRFSPSRPILILDMSAV